MDDLERLIEEATTHPISGWDFNWLGERITFPSPAWDFDAMVVSLARRSVNLLDLGTGGGEWLSTLAVRPPVTIATESWPANVDLASRRLANLAIPVVQVEGAGDNSRQDELADNTPRLPFVDASFHLICSRHESFVANEVSRFLDRGGHFITEQVGDGVYRDFRRLLEIPEGHSTTLSIELIVSQLQSAGLSVVASAHSEGEVRFADVGALAWYLRMVPWIIPGFSVHDHHQRFAALHQLVGSGGTLTARLDSLYVVAAKRAP
jgi:hypothetical protein